MKIFKSYSFWTALAGAVVVFVEALGKLFGFSVASEAVSGVIMAFAGVLVVLGIVTMPKSGDKEPANKSDSAAEDEAESENKDGSK